MVVCFCVKAIIAVRDFLQTVCENCTKRCHLYLILRPTSNVPDKGQSLNAPTNQFPCACLVSKRMKHIMRDAPKNCPIHKNASSIRFLRSLKQPTCALFISKSKTTESRTGGARKGQQRRARRDRLQFAAQLTSLLRSDVMEP